MSCKLCQRDLILKRSHIVPEFFYKQSYDSKGRAHIFFTDEENPNPKDLVQKGLREDLLCGACETVINKLYEKKFCDFWYQKQNIPTKVKVDGVIKIQFDYQLLLGLILSIVWRASIASGEHFEHINLERENEERVRCRIFNETTIPKCNNYYLLGSVVTDNDGVVIRDLVIPPVQSILPDHNIYRMIFGGVEWHLKIYDHGAPEQSAIFLNYSGSLHLCQTHISQTIAAAQVKS